MLFIYVYILLYLNSPAFMKLYVLKFLWINADIYANTGSIIKTKLQTFFSTGGRTLGL